MAVTAGEGYNTMSWLFGSKNNTTTETNTGEQPYITEAAAPLAGALGNAYGQPYQPYQGPRIAELTPDQLNAMQQTRDMGGISQLGYNEAMDYTRGAAGPISAGEIQHYIDPYIGDVADRTAEAMRRQNSIDAQQWRDQMVGAGGWGGFGGRLAIQEAENARTLQDQMGSMYANMYSNAWNTGLGAAQSDRGRALNVGNQLGNQVTGRQSAAYRDIAALGAVGDTAQGQIQKNYDLAYGDFKAQRDYPKQQLSDMADVIARLRAPSSGTRSATAPKEGFFNQIVGGLGSLATLW